MHHIVNQSPRRSAGACLADGLCDLDGWITKPAFLLMLIVWLSHSIPAQASDILSELTQAQQDAIALNCTALQFTQGATAYRECVRQELAAAQATANPEEDLLADISIDEQFAIQRACNRTASVSPVDYASCARAQLEEMNQVPRPQLSLATEDEHYIITGQCFETQTTAGARAYRECVNTALSTLEALPAADFAARSAAERNNIQLECSISSGDVAIYRQCLLRALGIAFEPITSSIAPADTMDTPQADPDANPDSGLDLVPNTDESPQALNDSDSPDDPLEQETQATLPEPEVTAEEIDNEPIATLTNTEVTNSSESTTPESGQPLSLPETSENSQPLPDRPTNFLNTAKDSLQSLAPAHWIALLAALSLPLVFFLVKSARQPVRVSQRTTQATRNARQSDSQNRGQPSVHAPVKPYPASSYPAGVQDDADEDDEFLSMDQTFMPDTLAVKDDQPTVLARTRIKPGKHSIARELRFIDWLSYFDAKAQQEYAIEFLIYWMAYADNRYDPALKQQVFQMQNPDIRSLIKRWVFKKDAVAFSDVIGFLQTSTTTTQRRQIIELLMALLVTEQALTPIQNNLLRFLADAFGIYTSGLNELFTRAYGYAMPAIPRPDKTLWWNQLTPEQKLRWDARAVARQPDQIRYRIALGQPLKGDLNQKSVERSFNLAMRRCHRDKVNQLGEREMTLLETQKRKFEIAHDALLEPIT